MFKTDVETTTNFLLAGFGPNFYQIRLIYSTEILHTGDKGGGGKGMREGVEGGGWGWSKI